MARRCARFLLFVLAAATGVWAQGNPPLRTYETRYYVIHTDLGRDAAREAELRMTRMAEEYRRRTRDFSGELRGKLPFYLFRNEADYRAADGTPNTAGEYDPNTRTLKTFVGVDGPNLVTWHTVQHEGFHQFADQVIGRGLPIWANEGLAEYFAEAIFTGDSFTPGVIPPWRLKRVRETLEAGRFPPLRETALLSHEAWNERISTIHYDHVWSLVQYLVHGDGGENRDRLAAFLKATSGARPDAEGAFIERAFVAHLGQFDDVEAKWREYWTKLSEDPTADLYAGATLRTLTSFLARATARRQRFDSFESFHEVAANGELKSFESDWLPPSLLKDALTRADRIEKGGGRFTILSDAPRPPKLALITGDGKKMVGQFKLEGSRVDRVMVERPLVPSPATPEEG